MLRLRGISAFDLSTHCIARIKIKHGSSAHALIIRIISSSEITERRYENKNFTMLFQGILIRQAFVNLEKEYDKAL